MNDEERIALEEEEAREQRRGSAGIELLVDEHEEEVSEGGRTVRRWESGQTRVPGPVAFAMKAIEARVQIKGWEQEVVEDA